MPSLRETWRIVLDDVADPIIVRTNAWDQVGLSIPVADGAGQVPLDFQYQIIHNACLREEIPGVPRSFRAFMLALAEADQVTEEATEELDPTRTPALDG